MQSMRQQLVRVLSNSPLAPFAVSIKSYIDVTDWKCNSDVATWEQNGQPVPPPFGYKRQLIRDYADRYNLHVMLETGTYLGHMCYSTQDIFSRIATIELDPSLHAAAKKRLSRYPHVECHLGDSGEALPRLLASIHEPCQIWLDAHYSAGRTAKGSVETPISAELDVVLNHQVRNHVVLIDDARGFDGTHDYPRMDDLRKTVTALRPDLSFTVEHDIIRMVPTESTL
jgi:hypothetical protein